MDWQHYPCPSDPCSDFEVGQRFACAGFSVIFFIASVHLEVKILNVSFTERITSKNDRSFFTRSRSLLSCKSCSC